MSNLLIGVAETEFTPPVGTPLTGGIHPRPSKWVQDPLMLKAAVLESGGVRMAHVTFDLCLLPRTVGESCVAAAAAKTGIPPQNIVWGLSHAHATPYTGATFPCGPESDPVDKEWVATLPGKAADCVWRAAQEMAPVRVSRVRGYNSSLSHNRRLRYKDGREINTWLLNGEEDGLQCVGAAGPIDPEINVLGFEDESGKFRCIMYEFALHANANGNHCLGADFPGVVAARMRERFGAQVVTLFLPGTCGDINPVMGYRQIGDTLADNIISRLDRRKLKDDGPLKLAVLRREITVPVRDFRAPQEDRIERSQWDASCKDAFRRDLEKMRQYSATEVTTSLSAWRIGDVGFAGLPGEGFVQWGILLKQKSAFPWTLPVELCGDSIGYLVTPQAWEAGGYEPLISRYSPVSVRGSEMIVEKLLQMLNELWAQN
jgi:hypothetical protein